jgi:hypothetical protein
LFNNSPPVVILGVEEVEGVEGVEGEVIIPTIILDLPDSNPEPVTGVLIRFFNSNGTAPPTI